MKELTEINGKKILASRILLPQHVESKYGIYVEFPATEYLVQTDTKILPRSLPNNPSLTMKELEQKIRELVPNLMKAPTVMPLPVKYDGMGYYWGKDGEMVADWDEGVNVGDGFRIRGWGRIQYIKAEKTPEELQDECAYYIADAINAYSSIQLHHVLQALYGEESDSNDNWSYVAGIHGTTLIFAMHETVEQANWNLSKDLSGQDEETINFLKEILIK